MRGLRLKRAPGGQQCRRAALALLPPRRFARGCFWVGDVLAGLGEGSDGPPCFSVCDFRSRGSLAFATASSRAALSAVVPPGSEGEAAAASPRRACTRQAARSRARPEAPRPVVSPAQPSSTDNHGRRHRGHGRRRPAARGPAEHDVRRRPAQAVESVVVRAAREGWQPARRHERFIKVVDGFDTSASEKSPAEATAEDLAFDPV